MNATFNPVKGFKLEFTYDRADLSHAIAAQVAVWVHAIASKFLGFCEETVTKGHQARSGVNDKVIQALEVGSESLREAVAQTQELAIELAIATGRRIQRQTQRLLLPPINRLVERYLSVRNEVQSALRTYIEGGVGERIQVNALTQGPVMLPSGDVETQGQELLVPKSDNEAIAEAENTSPVSQEEKTSPSVSQLSDKQPEQLAGDQENDEDTVELRPKHKGRRRYT